MSSRAMRVWRSLQTPLGTLSEPTIYPTDNGAKPVEVVDVNLDSRPDVVTAHNSSNVVGVYLQQPDGSLRPCRSQIAPAAPARSP
ncbi:hypothetical protein BH18ACT13_BH18ACT13_19900 [soil metagenome]